MKIHVTTNDGTVLDSWVVEEEFGDLSKPLPLADLMQSIRRIWERQSKPTLESSNPPERLSGTHAIFEADGHRALEEKPLVPGDAMRLSYYTRHVGTGKVFYENHLLRNRHVFEECLKLWNIQGCGTWHYTAEPPPSSDGEDTTPNE